MQPDLEPRLSRYIWRHTWRQQLWILVIVLLSMVPYFMALGLPKEIVNGPIQGRGFATPDATQVFFNVQIWLPFLGTTTLFSGIALPRMQTLFALSGVFLLLVIVNGLIKFYINTYKGRLGERLLRRIRFELVDRLLRFPPTSLKRVKPAEVSSMVKDEVEPLGGFTGDAFVVPALLGGQALTSLSFIVMQSYWLGAITAALVGLQGTIIPRMRRRLLVLGRQRQLTARELSGRVGEIVDGIATIHALDTSNYERADISARLGRIFRIRYDLYQWKFMVKFLNNFLASITPFLFYAVGGYLALKGRLDIGQLVAVIGAYENLPGPLKDLITWDQNRQDVQIKYTQIVSQFAVDGMIDPEIQRVLPPQDTPPAPPQPVAASNLHIADDSGAAILERLNLKIAPGDLVAIIGDAASGGEAFADALGRLVWAHNGRVLLGDQDILSLPEAITGRRITYAGSEAFFFYGTLRDNLLYSLKHAPLRPPERDAAAMAAHENQLDEARRSGNPPLDHASDWIDYASAGATGPDDLFPVLREVLGVVMLENDIVDLALRSVVDPARYDGLAGQIVALRAALRDDLQARGLSGLVVPFEPDVYNAEATIGENLLFGTVIGERSLSELIASSKELRAALVQAGLDRDLFAVGFQIAEHAVELFSDLPPDHPFFEQLSFMSADDLPLYQTLIQTLHGRAYADVAAEDRARIIGLSFHYIEPRHRFGLLTDELRARIVALRLAVQSDMPDSLKAKIEIHDPAGYTSSASIIDNVLFGRISLSDANAVEKVQAAVRGLLASLGLYDRVVSIGLDFHAGAGGKRMTSVQRQKLNMARALIRRSDLYVFNRPLSGIDGRTQEIILRNVIAFLRRDGCQPGLLWVLANARHARHFDRVALFAEGALVDDGSYDALIAKQGMFQKMVSE